MIANVIVFLYGGTYPATRWSSRASAESLERLLSSKTQAQRGHEKLENPLTFHASLYGVAEKFEYPDLKEACRNAYIRSLCQKNSTSDFISSIHVVYEITPAADKGLRKWAVFVSQGYKSRLRLHPSFKALFTSRLDFSWDLTTAYMEVKDYYCSICEKNIPCDKAGCVCGHSGICSGALSCAQEDEEPLYCLECDGYGMTRVCDSAENPRFNFENKVVDDALRREVHRVAKQ